MLLLSDTSAFRWISSSKATPSTFAFFIHIDFVWVTWLKTLHSSVFLFRYVPCMRLPSNQASLSVFFFRQCSFTGLSYQSSHSICQSSFGVSTLCGSSSNHATPFVFFFRHFNFMGLLYQPSLSTYLCIPIVPLPQFPHTFFSPSVHHIS